MNRLLHSQPYMNSHYYFLIMTISAIRHVIIRSSKTSPTILAAFTSVPDMLGRSVQLSWMSFRQCSNCLHHFLIFCTLVKPSPQTSKHWQLISMEQICFARNAPSFICYICYKCYFLLKSLMFVYPISVKFGGNLLKLSRVVKLRIFTLQTHPKKTVNTGSTNFFGR